MSSSNPPSKQPLSLRQIFARNVRMVRVHSGMSQESMAAIAELDRAFVGTLERGTRNISIDNIELIAKAINTEPSDLMKPDLPELRSLDPSVSRSPRSARLYPIARKVE